MARPPQTDSSLPLTLAVVGFSSVPLLLLDDRLSIIAGSHTFWAAFDLDPDMGAGRHLSQLGDGEWNAPRLRSLLSATISGDAEIAAYEMDFQDRKRGVRRLVLKAEKLAYGDGLETRVLLSIDDVTDARADKKVNEDLLREKAMLLRELQHRVANSLQIIASVILQSARKSRSDEARLQLNDAHNRVMSVASLQEQLARSQISDVELRAYFTKLCSSLGASMIHDHDLITIEVDSQESYCAPDASISLGLIVTELTINALKHAFLEGRRGRVLVGYRSNGPDWTLTVEDDGIGMPERPAPAKPGLGTSIVDALARQLGARVQTESATPGTRVSITQARTGIEPARVGVPGGEAV
ncbi:sensor histidine kinase [Brevundimonas sp.]|uniref:sensor histidine kinase n=1 Tax=Brevundimonas sp. TaxID=1871086 RepID=UPI002D48C2C9|nr:sensor histidine kinase [Brevundimonas sp.]HYC99018.1 sensor histidine kinase [Brevundimonas sp.]